MTPKPRHRSWPPLLTLVLALFLALTVWSIDQARRKVSPVTDADYYDHGLKFTGTELERHRAAGPDWSLAVRLQGRAIEARVNDAAGRAVAGGRGEVTLPEWETDPGHQPVLTLSEEAPGCYRGVVPGGLRGQVPARLTLVRGGVRLQRSLLLSL